MEDKKKYSKTYTPKQALLKAESYCAYQERSQQEVRDKLYSWGLHYNDVEEIISKLILDNFLNEERFAIAYAQGKFRMRGWGKVKLKYHLKGKRVSAPLIKIALAKIDMDEYLTKMDEIINKYISKPLNLLTVQEKSKLIRHLQNKGYENELIFEKMNKK